jgi:hypothetical protein
MRKHEILPPCSRDPKKMLLIMLRVVRSRRAFFGAALVNIIGIITVLSVFSALLNLCSLREPGAGSGGRSLKRESREDKD